MNTLTHMLLLHAFRHKSSVISCIWHTDPAGEVQHLTRAIIAAFSRGSKGLSAPGSHMHCICSAGNKTLQRKDDCCGVWLARKRWRTRVQHCIFRTLTRQTRVDVLYPHSPQPLILSGCCCSWVAVSMTMHSTAGQVLGGWDGATTIELQRRCVCTLISTCHTLVLTKSERLLAALHIWNAQR